MRLSVACDFRFVGLRMVKTLYLSSNRELETMGWVVALTSLGMISLRR